MLPKTRFQDALLRRWDRVQRRGKTLVGRARVESLSFDDALRTPQTWPSPQAVSGFEENLDNAVNHFKLLRVALGEK